MSHCQILRVQIHTSGMGIKTQQLSILLRIALASIANEIAEFKWVCSALLGMGWWVVDFFACVGIAGVVLPDKLEEDVGLDAACIGVIVEPVGEWEVVSFVICPSSSSQSNMRRNVPRTINTIIT